MICTKFDAYMRKITKELQMLWICYLNDGTTVYSDYDRPGLSDHPWDRLKRHCESNDLYPTKVEVLMFGAPYTVLFEDPDGLDGLFIARGAARDINEATGEGTSYKQLVVGVLRDGEECVVDVKKFSWPENEIEPFSQTRNLTPENAQWMLFKNGSIKKRSEQVQVALNG
jgi:hypothetical protein